MNDKITKTFTITCNSNLMYRFEKFLSLICLSSQWGHSSIFGLFVDGDGADRFDIDPVDRSYAKDIELITHVGYDLEEVGSTGAFLARDIDKNKPHWKAQGEILYRDGKPFKKIGENGAEPFYE